MTGLYLAMQVGGRMVGPIIAFREYIFRDVLPSFSNIDERANQVANDYFNGIASQPVGEYDDIDMGSVADAAQDQSLHWWEMMTSLRQTMLNLLAAGLFHLAEQQLALLAEDAAFAQRPLGEKGLTSTHDWYLKHFALDMRTLPSWARMDELRLVANAVKHAEGPAMRQLKASRPELFSNPAYADIYAEYEEAGIVEQIGRVPAPLSGEDFFVTEEFLKQYAEGAESFFAEIETYFRSRGEMFF